MYNWIGPTDKHVCNDAMHVLRRKHKHLISFY